ncbi:MAG: hypothetical protein V7739_15395 [Motiliproteus sp.]
MSNFETAVDGESLYTYGISKQSSDQNSTTVDRAEFSTILNGRARSRGFIWKPWFSDFGLNGLATVRHTTTKTGGEQASTDDERMSLNTTGKANLTLLPGSRFPFKALLTHRELFSDDDGDSERRYATDLTLGQSYKGLGRNAILATAGLRILDGNDEEATDSEADLRTSVSQTFENQSYSANFDWLTDGRTTKETGVKSEAETKSLFGEHSYDIKAQHINVRTFSSVIESESSNAANVNNVQVWQLVNNLSWSPQRIQGLELSSDTRFSTFDTKSSGVQRVQRESIIFGNNLSADYEVNRNLSTDALLDTSFEEQDGVAEIDFTESVGAGYQSDPVQWELWEYRWFAGSRLGSSQGDTASGTTLVGNYEHSLGQRDWYPLFDRGRSHLQLSQGVSYSALETEGAPIALTHSASYSWNRAESDFSDTLIVTLTDSRDIGGEVRERQQLDGQIQRDQQYFGDGKLNLDLFGQLFRSVDEDEDDEDDEDDVVIAGSLSGAARLSKSSVFGIPRLDYELDLTVNYNKIFQSPEEDEGVPFDVSLNSLLRWRFGRLSSKFRVSVTANEEETDAEVYIEVKRLWAM